MKRKGILALLLIACLLTSAGTAMAAEVECDSVYCFGTEDFSGEQETIRGICITSLPQEGTVYLGTRVIRKGDILSASQVEEMTFQPLKTQADCEAQVGYLPIYENRVEKNQVMTISIRGKEDKAPEAKDSAVETYKNLEYQGKLQAQDPEGKMLTYTLQRNPKRGTVELKEDGTFLYTPKKNKVGVDSFTYTAADPAGNVSREATVTIQILKPTDARQYQDTDASCRFEAEWMRNTGLFVGESVAGEQCFYPEKELSRGQFLSMLMKTLDLKPEKQETGVENAPAWLQPYLVAANRAGLTANLEDLESWNWDEPISCKDAAVMVQNALDLESDETEAVAVMAENGIELEAEQVLTRAQGAKLLYRVSALSVDAPGMAVLRMQ